MSPVNHAASMRELFSYVERFRGKRFVVRIDDALIYSDLASAVVGDLSRLIRLGIEIVVVAGARNQIDTILDRFDLPSTSANGFRISTTEQMPLIEMAAFDAATKVMTLFTGDRIDAVIGNWVRARTIGVVGGVDFEQTGRVDAVDLARVERALDEEFVPILPCIGWNRRGQPYNISSAHLACEIAKRLSASKLIYWEATAPNHPGRLKRSEVAAVLETRSDELLEYAIEATGAGVDRAHIIGGSDDGALLSELFTNVGSGTMVYANQYESIRPAERRDLHDMLRVMEPHVRSGRLLERTESDLEDAIDELFVYEIDGTVHGTIGLKRYPGETAEIYAIAVDESVAELGVGRALVKHLIESVREGPVSRLVACTTQAFDWFHELGFEHGTVNDLPTERKGSYDPKRNPRVVFLDTRSRA